MNCKRCGVTVEMVPWCDGKNQLTTTYRWFLANWAKRLSWSEVSSIFRTSWDSVYRAVEHAVEWGLSHRDLSDVTALGVDEIAWARGHRYLTLVYDIGNKTKRLLAVAEDRTEESLRCCLDSLGESVCLGVKHVCSDMWKPYRSVIAEKLGQALHVLDRFHVMQQFGKALDELRAGARGKQGHAARTAMEGLRNIFMYSVQPRMRARSQHWPVSQVAVSVPDRGYLGRPDVPSRVP